MVQPAEVYKVYGQSLNSPYVSGEPKCSFIECQYSIVVGQNLAFLIVSLNKTRVESVQLGKT